MTARTGSEGDPEQIGTEKGSKGNRSGINNSCRNKAKTVVLAATAAAAEVGSGGSSLH